MFLTHCLIWGSQSSTYSAPWAGFMMSFILEWFTTPGICMVHLEKSSWHNMKMCNNTGECVTELPERALHPRLIILKRKMTINWTKNCPRSYKDSWNRGVRYNKQTIRICNVWEKRGGGKQWGWCDPARHDPTASWGLPGSGSTAPHGHPQALPPAHPHPAWGRSWTCTPVMWGHLPGAARAVRCPTADVCGQGLPHERGPAFPMVYGWSTTCLELVIDGVLEIYVYNILHPFGNVAYLLHCWCWP